MAGQIRLDRLARLEDLQDLDSTVGPDDHAFARHNLDQFFQLQPLHGLMDGSASHPEQRGDRTLVDVLSWKKIQGEDCVP